MITVKDAENKDSEVKNINVKNDVEIIAKNENGTSPSSVEHKDPAATGGQASTTSATPSALATVTLPAVSEVKTSQTTPIRDPLAVQRKKDRDNYVFMIDVALIFIVGLLSALIYRL
jgi:hypothetical protein